MSDFTNTKAAPGATIQTDAVETTWQDGAPLITPTEVRELHLFGIPLFSAIKDPRTGKPQEVTDPLLAQYINEAVSLAEAEAGIEIFPRSHNERHPYDQQLANAFGYMMTRHRPVQSVESLAIVSSDGISVWSVPLVWLDLGYLARGQIHVMPFAVAAQSGVSIPITSPVGQGLLPSLFRFNWVPGLWTIKYTSGFKNSVIPKIVNQLIGVVAAMEVLSMLATTLARVQSSSLGIDGLSQSLSTPGPQIYQVRLEYLADKRKWLTSRIKKSLGLGLFVDSV